MNQTTGTASNAKKLKRDANAHGTDRCSCFPAQAVETKWLESFKEFPPRAKAASFTVGDATEKIYSIQGNK